MDCLRLRRLTVQKTFFAVELGRARPSGFIHIVRPSVRRAPPDLGKERSVATHRQPVVHLHHVVALDLETDLETDRIGLE